MEGGWSCCVGGEHDVPDSRIRSWESLERQLRMVTMPKTEQQTPSRVKKDVSTWKGTWIYGGQSISGISTSSAWQSDQVRVAGAEKGNNASTGAKGKGQALISFRGRWRWRENSCDGMWTDGRSQRQSMVRRISNEMRYQSSWRVRKVSHSRILGQDVGTKFVLT